MSLSLPRSTLPLMCPLCQRPLSIVHKSWHCASGHCFDIAKQGYVNLLPVHFKNSKNPGDSVAAVQARREFLQQGFYQPLKEQLMQCVAALKPQVLVDVGCGEGYYTTGLRAHVPCVIGLDIAKNAVQLAARRDPSIHWLVASAASLPIADSAVDLLTSFFSPLPLQEMQRVLKPQGHVLVATPAARHVQQVRAGLFQQVNPHQPEKIVQGLATHFTLVQQHTLTFPMQLTQTALRQLIAMTPYAWKAPPHRRAQLESQARLHTQASFQIYLFEKIQEPAGASPQCQG